MQKNDIVQITITDMTDQGEGLGKADGYPLFVKDTVIGDVAEVKVVKAKKTYGYARLMRILQPSPDRIQPRCPSAGPCGGCQLQAMSYPAQLAFKRRKVENHIRRIGGFSMEVCPVIGMEEPWGYRNKCQVPVGRGKDGEIRMGFYAGRTHSIIETEHCLLGSSMDAHILKLIRAHMKGFSIPPYDEETGKGLVRHVLIRSARATGEIMVCIVINGSRLPHADVLVNTLRDVPGMTSVSVNINREKGNAILGKEVVNLWGPGYITDRIGRLSYRISPLAFFQVNPVQTEKLYATALDFAGLTGNETVWDLYCGTGTISLFLAGKAKQVYGVEIIPEAIQNAKENAAINHISNAEFFVGKAEEVLPEYNRRVLRETGEYPKADVIVVDPPRKGCDEALLAAVLAQQPERIVYVSCDSATLARDLKILCTDGAYKIQKIQPVDMFPQTVHVETVCCLYHQKKEFISVPYEPKNADYLKRIPGSATYDEIKEWVQKHYDGMKVSNLYIAQIKDKHGLDKRENYNISKNSEAKVPVCPPEKEQAIEAALRHFRMIPQSEGLSEASPEQSEEK